MIDDCGRVTREQAAMPQSPRRSCSGSSFAVVRPAPGKVLAPAPRPRGRCPATTPSVNSPLRKCSSIARGHVLPELVARTSRGSRRRRGSGTAARAARCRSGRRCARRSSSSRAGGSGAAPAPRGPSGMRRVTWTRISAGGLRFRRGDRRDDAIRVELREEARHRSPAPRGAAAAEGAAAAREPAAAAATSRRRRRSRRLRPPPKPPQPPPPVHQPRPPWVRKRAAARRRSREARRRCRRRSPRRGSSETGPRGAAGPRRRSGPVPSVLALDRRHHRVRRRPRCRPRSRRRGSAAGSRPR